MIQFYFLSVFLNLLVGFILFFGKSPEQEEEQKSEPEEKLNPDDDISFLDTDYRGVKLPHQKKSVNGMFAKNSVLNDKLFQLVLGVLSIFVAIMKLLSAVNGIPFLGDIVPALAGLLISIYSCFLNIMLKTVLQIWSCLHFFRIFLLSIKNILARLAWLRLLFIL